MTVTGAGTMRAFAAADSNPELVAAREKVDRLQSRLERLDRVLEMDRQDRFATEPELYTDCYNAQLPRLKNKAMMAALGGLAVGCGLSMWASMTPGLQQLSGLIALGTLAVTFVPPVAKRVSPMALYAWAAKKWTVPPAVDREMKQRLGEQREHVEVSLGAARDRRDALVEKLVKELSALEQPGEGQVELGEDFVVVNDIMVPANSL